ncbi:MAG: hypothetical protein WCG23_11225 [bacterium]
MNNETSITVPTAQEQTFDSLAESYVTARNKFGNSLLEMASVCVEAKEQLKKEGEWLKWLADSRINLKETQAKKFIAIAEHCKKMGQLTDLLNKKGIEETYLLTRISDETARKELAEQIINVDFTVKETRQLVKKVNELEPVAEAIEEVKKMKDLPKSEKIKYTINRSDCLYESRPFSSYDYEETKHYLNYLRRQHRNEDVKFTIKKEVEESPEAEEVKPERKSVSINKFNKLQSDYEVLKTKMEEQGRESSKIQYHLNQRVQQLAQLKVRKEKAKILEELSFREEVIDRVKYCVTDEQGESLIYDENYEKVKSFFDSQKESKKELKLFKEIHFYKKALIEEQESEKETVERMDKLKQYISSEIEKGSEQIKKKSKKQVVVVST